MNNVTAEPWAHDTEYTRYTLWFIYACIIYSIIGFSWGALMGGIADFRHFVDHRLHGNLIVRAHTHVNLLGWVEMAIFGAVYYIVPRLVQRETGEAAFLDAQLRLDRYGGILHRGGCGWRDGKSEFLAGRG